MVLNSRVIANPSPTAHASGGAAVPQRRFTVPAAKPPQVLQSGHAPAQLSFCFTRS